MNDKDKIRYSNWLEHNKDHIKEYRKNYYLKNREKKLEDTKKYQQENKDRIRIRKTKWMKQQRETNPQIRIKDSLRARVRAVFQRDNITKKNTTNELIGCDFDFLKKYLESLFKEGMTWENYGEWHIDHIVPCDSFDLTDTEQQKKCFNYNNLQPLWKFDNLSKGNKIL